MHTVVSTVVGGSLKDPDTIRHTTKSDLMEQPYDHADVAQEDVLYYIHRENRLGNAEVFAVLGDDAEEKQVWAMLIDSEIDRMTIGDILHISYEYLQKYHNTDNEEQPSVYFTKKRPVLHQEDTDYIEEQLGRT